MEDNLNKYREISFPLNVYAFLTFFQTGEFRELHYGLFNDPGNNLIQAQEHSTDLLFKYLYKSPSKLLEVGVGLGKTHQKLIDKGFDCTGITPDVAQIAIVHEMIKDANLVCTRFEDFNPQTGGYDVILFQESAQYIATHDLFIKGYQLLAPHGRILIVDEFSRKGERLHNLDSFISQAEHIGFKLTHKEDLSVKAAPTVDFILKGLAEYQGQICRELELPVKQLEDLSETLWEYKKKYDEREFAYFFFEFEKKQENRVSVQGSEIKILSKRDTVGIITEGRDDSERTIAHLKAADAVCTLIRRKWKQIKRLSKFLSPLFFPFIPHCLSLYM